MPKNKPELHECVKQSQRDSNYCHLSCKYCVRLTGIGDLNMLWSVNQTVSVSMLSTKKGTLLSATALILLPNLCLASTTCHVLFWLVLHFGQIIALIWSSRLSIAMLETKWHGGFHTCTHFMQPINSNTAL